MEADISLIMADAPKTRKDSKQEVSEVAHKLGLHLCEKCGRGNAEVMNGLLGRLYADDGGWVGKLEAMSREMMELRKLIEMNLDEKETKLKEEKMEVLRNRAELDEIKDEIKSIGKKMADFDIKPLSNRLREVDTATKKWSDLFKEKVDVLVDDVRKVHSSVLVRGDEQINNIKTCLERALDVQKQEDREEEAERMKRRTSVIIHGLKESGSTDSVTRRLEDKTEIEDMLKNISCSDVGIVNVIRLGKRTEGGSEPARPRPLKLVLEKEEQQQHLLRQAKNLRTIKEGGRSEVFIHQDMTPKERETRKLLVKEMKVRQQGGELNLRIAGNRIVIRRPFNAARD